ncbi:phosphoribosylglycinamide formyltransferase 2 [Kitasatospora sp. NE20-6]|uniref:hypothetical protein n=1 Tax=Kitasatospora sp. NE20-6 TaxID=2859066 RepID=UPI0034DC1246
MTAAAVRFGSCDAERHWRPAGPAALPALRDPHAERLLGGMDELLAVLCGPDDVLVTRHRAPAAFAELMREAGFGARHVTAPGPADLPVEQRLAEHGLPGLEGAAAQPYAVVPGTHEAARRLGLAGTLPDLDALRRVNSKTWSTLLGLPGSGRVVTTLAELDEAATVPCVLKDPYGVAGQGNRVVDSPARLALVRRGLERLPQDHLELVVQPLYERGDDFAAHLVVGPDGGTRWLGVRRLVNEGHSFRGSGPVTAGLMHRLDRAGYRETVEKVAAAAAAEGYHGPLTVDSMTTADGTLVPVLEVNARFSPGLIALHLGAPLRMAFVKVGDERFFERFVQALAERGRLAVGGRPGILPLAASTLVPPRGWLFYAVLGEDAADGRDTADNPDTADGGTGADRCVAEILAALT